MIVNEKIKEFIPFSLPMINEAEVNEVIDTLQSGWLTTGPKTKKFSQDLKAYIGATTVIPTSSCTAALHISYAVSGLGLGDEAIMSPMTFAATANMAVHLGAIPCFVDIDEDTENIDHNKIEEAINERTKLIVPVDFAGHPCDLEPIAEIAKKHGIRIVEDAAHAIGSEYRGKKIGSHPWQACFSFYPIKNMTTGEGGAIASTDDPEFVERCNLLILHGLSKDAWSRYSEKGKWYYEIIEPGFKYNMTDLQAAIGIHQLAKLDGFIERRCHIATLYDKAFKDIPNIHRPVVNEGVRHAWHLYVIRLRDLPRGLTRNKVIEELEKRKIGTTVNFIPLHLHPYYRDRYGLKPEDFPVATWAYEGSISLPLYPRMADADAEYVAEQLINILKG